jgi:hypothetical protein
MSRIIRLSESDLVKIVKRVIKEQGIIGALADPSNVGLGVNTDVGLGGSGGCKKDNPSKNKLTQLFTYCNKVQSDTNTTKIKAWNDRLYRSMKGLGTNEDFIKVLDEIKTINELAAIWKTFKYDNENLWQWMGGEMKYSWDDTWSHLKKFQSIADISNCLEYNKSDML